MPDSADRNAAWAGVFLDELARAGVRDVCISPGSRSTPLVLACARDGRFRSHVHLDERSSGFFALGIGRATGRPALVVTTSGTAAANLFPAVVEASQAEVPLLVATADRPHRLRGADANQAIDQLHLFGSAVRAFFEVAPPEVDAAPLDHLRALASRSFALALGAPAGPVHLNFPFDKPLEPRLPARPGTTLPAGRSEGRPHTRISPARLAVDPADVERVAALLPVGGRAVLLAGPSSEAAAVGPAARAVARAAGIPLLADPLSGARFGGGSGAENVVAGYDLFLRDPERRRAMTPDVVLRVGTTPTSSAVHALLDGCRGSRQIVIDGGGRWKDHHSAVEEYLRTDPAAFLQALATRLSSGRGRGARPDEGPDSSWLDCWTRAERVTREVAAREVAGGFFEGTVLATVAAAMTEGDGLFVSSSMPVRDLDAFGAPGKLDFPVYGNRGASGIDGIVSTALGVAAGREGGRVTVVLGDIAFYHDMNGLLATREGGMNVTFVVIHNDGGGIFSMLPIREHEPDFTPFFATPHGLDFQHAARLYDLPYEKVSDAQGLKKALSKSSGGAGEAGAEGCTIIEVTTDREDNRRRHLEVVEAVQAALGGDA